MCWVSIQTHTRPPIYHYIMDSFALPILPFILSTSLSLHFWSPNRVNSVLPVQCSTIFKIVSTPLMLYCSCNHFIPNYSDPPIPFLPFNYYYFQPPSLNFFVQPRFLLYFTNTAHFFECDVLRQFLVLPFFIGIKFEYKVLFFSFWREFLRDKSEKKQRAFRSNRLRIYLWNFLKLGQQNIWTSCLLHWHKLSNFLRFNRKQAYSPPSLSCFTENTLHRKISEPRKVSCPSKLTK